MKSIQFAARHVPLLLVAGLLVSAVALAAKPQGAGAGQDSKPNKAEQRLSQPNESPGRRDRFSGHFDSHHRTLVRNYYNAQYRAGRCPPGLARTNDGCMPPGQARHWAVGQPLPRDVMYYSLPPAFVVRLGVPPSGQRFVRVASDILLVGSDDGVVLDGIVNQGES